MKRIRLNLILTLSVAFLATTVLIGQVTIPTPDVALTFEGDTATYTVEVPDISGNDNHAYWYNYFRYDGEHPDSTLYAGYYPDSGKFNGAWYISGYHQSCCNLCSSSDDFIVLAGNNQDWDMAEAQGQHPVFHTDMQGLTVMFWFKSSRDYSLTDKIPCPKGSVVGMHEQELLFSHGKRNAIAINNDKGFYSVKVGYQPEGGTAENKEIRLVYDGVGQAKKTWQHIAVTFDGANGGALTMYIDGEIGVSGYGDPNPVATGYDSIRTDLSSTEIGAQNNAGLYGDPGNGVWNAPNEQCCVPEDSKLPKYRTGWPAAGYYDDFVFFKDTALSQEQVQLIMNSGIEAAMGGGTNIDRVIERTSTFYPNPSSGMINIRLAEADRENLTIYNVVGSTVFQKQVYDGERVDIASLDRGVYLVKLGTSVSKLIVR